MTRIYKGVEIATVEHSHYGLRRVNGSMLRRSVSYSAKVGGFTVYGGTIRQTWQRAQVAQEWAAQGIAVRDPRDVYDEADRRFAP